MVLATLCSQSRDSWITLKALGGGLAIPNNYKGVAETTPKLAVVGGLNYPHCSPLVWLTKW